MTTFTPQLIKDQEFEVKFRGFDPIEVRDYLETLADKFFELQEQCKEQSEELGTLREAEETSEEYKSSLETDMEFAKKMSEELKEGCSQKEEKIVELKAELEELQLRIADMEQENSEHDEELSADQVRIEEAEAALKASEAEKERLESRIDILQEQNDDLKKEEVDFKATLASAQRFAEDLKKKSQEEAAAMITDANAEIEKIREDARAELERLPLEIGELQKTKGEVKAELKKTLEGYLETIDVFYPDEQQGAVAEAEDGEGLFQKIALNEDGSLPSGDKVKIEEGAARAPAGMKEASGGLDSLFGDDGDEDTGGDEFKREKIFSLEPEDKA